MPHYNSGKFKCTKLAITSAILQLQCYQNSSLSALAIPGFSKYLGLLVEKTGVWVQGNTRLEALGASQCHL